MQQNSDPSAARDSFLRAISAGPRFVLPYEQLAVTAVQNGNWKEALSNTNRLASIYPQGRAQAWYFDALANYQEGNPDAAEAARESPWR